MHLSSRYRRTFKHDAGLQHHQFTCAYVEPGPVERQFSCLDPFRDPRKCHQIGERNPDHRMFAESLSFPGVREMTRVLHNRLSQRHPRRDELEPGMLVVRGSAKQGLHAAAHPVAEHDHVLHLHRADTELEGGAGAVIRLIGLIGRYERGDVADSQNFSRCGVENARRIDAAVDASKNEGFGGLSFPGQRFEDPALFRPPVVTKAPVAGEKFLHKPSIYAMPPSTLTAVPARGEFRAMLRIAIPLALAELGWMSMGVVDTIMVGRLPDSAVSIGAASIGNALFYVFAIFGLGLMSGLDTLVSQAFGAGDSTGARRALASGFGLAVCAAPLLAACILAAAPILALIGVTRAVRIEAVAFVRVLIWGLPLLLAYSVLRRYLQALHYVKPITFALVTANLVNAAGNWLLIFGHWGLPALGVRGSALSTVCARVYLAAVMFIAVRHRDPAAFVHMRNLFQGIGKLLRLGFPAALTIAFEVGVFNTATALAGTLDPVSLAAHTIALNAASVTYMVPLGIASAAAVSVGRAVGAGDRAGAARAGWMALRISVVFELFSALGFLVFPRQIARAYTDDPRVIALAATLLFIAAVFQLFDGLQTVATGALRGLGNTRTPMVWNLLGYWVIGLPLGCWLCFVRGWGVIGIWDGLCLALILIGLGLTAIWQKASMIIDK